MGPVMKHRTNGITLGDPMVAIRSKAAAVAAVAASRRPPSPPRTLESLIANYANRRNSGITQQWPRSYSLIATPPWTPVPLRAQAVALMREIQESPDGHI